MGEVAACLDANHAGIGAGNPHHAFVFFRRTLTATTLTFAVVLGQLALIVVVESRYRRCTTWPRVGKPWVVFPRRAIAVWAVV